MKLRIALPILLLIAFLTPRLQAQNWVPLTNANMFTYLNGFASENQPSSMNTTIPIQGAPGVLASGARSQACTNNFDGNQHPAIIYPSIPVGRGFDRDPTQYVITPWAQRMTGFKFTGQLSGVAGPSGNDIIESVFMTTQPCFAGGLEYGFVYYPVFGIYQFYWQSHANCPAGACVDQWNHPVTSGGSAINFTAPFNTVLTWQVNVQPDSGSPSRFGFVVNVTNPATGQIVFNNNGFPIQPGWDYNIGDFWYCPFSNFCGVAGYMVSTIYRRDTTGNPTNYYPFLPFIPEISVSSMSYTSQLLFYY
jgi:hypothetical protein